MPYAVTKPLNQLSTTKPPFSDSNSPGAAAVDHDAAVLQLLGSYPRVHAEHQLGNPIHGLGPALLGVGASLDGLDKLVAEVAQRFGGGGGGDGVAQGRVGDDARLAGPVQGWRKGVGKVWGTGVSGTALTNLWQKWSSAYP